MLQIHSDCNLFSSSFYIFSMHLIIYELVFEYNIPYLNYLCMHCTVPSTSPLHHQTIVQYFLTVPIGMSYHLPKSHRELLDSTLLLLSRSMCPFCIRRLKTETWSFTHPQPNRCTLT